MSQNYLNVINKYVTVQVSSQCFHLALGSWKNTNLINIAHELNILSKETLKCPIQKNLFLNFFSGTKIRQQKEFRISYDICMDVPNSLFYFNFVAAGIIQDRLMSKNELTEFSKLPNLEVARSQLCSVLQSAGSCLVGQLNQSQNILVSHLESHLQLQKSPDQPKEVKESNE